MVCSLLTKTKLWPLAVVALITASVTSAASVTVTPTVTPVAGGYNYSYTISETITNTTGGDDVFLIDIPVYASPSAVTDLTAPAGFTTAFDSGLGIVSFLENTSNFSSTPLGGFSFDSPIGPGSVMFDASVLSSTTADIYTVSGLTTSPAPAPEPSYAGLFVCLAPAILLYRRFRQAPQSTQI